MEGKIPNIIHFCWFGGEAKPSLVNQYIQSWKRYFPTYEIREWNDSHLHLIDFPYVQQAYQSKKYAFVSDVFRLYALKNYGGIYLDTDVEVFKSFDSFLHLNFFCSLENYHGKINPATAVLGAQKNNIIVSDLLDEYKNAVFIQDGKPLLYPNTLRLARYLTKKYKIEFTSDKETILLGEDGTIFPSDFFIHQAQNSYACHHFHGSWLPEEHTKMETIFCVKNRYTDAGKIKEKYIIIFGKKIVLQRKSIDV